MEKTAYWMIIPFLLMLLVGIGAATTKDVAVMATNKPTATATAKPTSGVVTPTKPASTKTPMKASPKSTPKPTAKPTVKPVLKTTIIKRQSPTKAPSNAGSVACTSSDLDLLARLVYAEAGSDWCSDEMQLLVANVVINRMRDPRFPSTLRGVIYQRGQYACAGKLGHVKPNARAVENARRVLAGERFCPAKVVFQSEFRQGRGLWKTVGNQYFCF